MTFYINRHSILYEFPKWLAAQMDIENSKMYGESRKTTYATIVAAEDGEPKVKYVSKEW